jgi:hypothetical protein
MAKIKPAGKSKKGPAGPAAPGAISCLIVIIGAIVLFGLLTYITFSKAQ